MVGKYYFWPRGLRAYTYTPEQGAPKRLLKKLFFRRWISSLLDWYEYAHYLHIYYATKIQSLIIYIKDLRRSDS